MPQNKFPTFYFAKSSSKKISIFGTITCRDIISQSCIAVILYTRDRLDNYTCFHPYTITLIWETMHASLHSHYDRLIFHYISPMCLIARVIIITALVFRSSMTLQPPSMFSSVSLSAEFEFLASHFRYLCSRGWRLLAILVEAIVRYVLSFLFQCHWIPDSVWL